MTHEAIEALALRRAAEVALDCAAEHRTIAEEHIRNGVPSFAVRSARAKEDAEQIADAILALAPMSPLQAALEVPEVRAVLDAMQEIADQLTPAEMATEGVEGDIEAGYEWCIERARAALEEPK
jgi:hypothetical protein